MTARSISLVLLVALGIVPPPPPASAAIRSPATPDGTPAGQVAGNPTQLGSNLCAGSLCP